MGEKNLLKRKDYRENPNIIVTEDSIYEIDRVCMREEQGRDIRKREYSNKEMKFFSKN